METELETTVLQTVYLLANKLVAVKVVELEQGVVQSTQLIQ